MSSEFDSVFRVEGGQVLATLIRLTGDIGLAEDALQDALIVAYQKWDEGWTPDNAAAWLTIAARNKALDRLRREARRHDKEREAVSLLDQQLTQEPNEPADLLRLIFTCCHPALSQEAQVALALRTLCGMTTAEIAAVHLVQETTMGQRISRAKKKISSASIPYRIPEEHELPNRLPSVLAALYLVFTMGHHASHGRLDERVDLADEGIRLARMLSDLMPDESEVRGLLALMLATHARRAARVSDGEIVLMKDQDRSLWDHEMIAEASMLIESSLRSGPTRSYQLQAAIAGLHSLAPTFEETDWPQIVVLYRLLETVQPTPVVRVNRVVAEAEVSGPEAGLALLSTVSGMERWHLYWSVKADLHRRAGETDLSADAYRSALDCEMNDTDRRFLESRLAGL